LFSSVANTTKGEIFVEIVVDETIVAQFEFGWFNIGRGIELCDMMTMDLVCLDKKLDL
jgi:hypothetical protein